MGFHVVEEAKRCLKCKNARCQKGCPVGTPVSAMMDLILHDRLEDAGRMIFENNPLSIVCSLVCPHENQCEGHCILGVKSNPIHVSSVEQYVADYYLNVMDLRPVKDPRRKVAIIGTGPAGITIAFILAARGYDVTMFESRDKIGGVLRYGIPAFRLPKDILERLKDKLLAMGVKIRLNTVIGNTLTVDHLFRDGYRAVFLGTGVWKPRALDIPGESLGHVHYAIDYLKNPEVYQLGNRVAVIGAGNVAMDVARTALRHGSREVTILYRKGEGDITALRHEVEYARLDGVRFAFFRQPVAFTDEGVQTVAMHVGVAPDGTEIVEEIPGSEDLFPADAIIVSISQGPRHTIVNSTAGIETDKSTGLLLTDTAGSTTRPGVFASGDVVTGARTVVEAVNLSKKVADAMAGYVEAQLAAEA